MFIHHLHLFTTQPDELHHFYRDTLGFHVENHSPEQFTLLAGRSRITFALSEEASYYHFAFNIPSNQSRKALLWLEERLDVLHDDGQKIIDFSNWNAEAVYFEDPAGNVVEFIARKDLDLYSQSPFSVALIEGVSEIGLPVGTVKTAFDQLRQRTGVEQYWGDLRRFCAAGDQRGLFIIVDKSEKTWYPTDKPAAPAPLELDFSQGGTRFFMKYDGKKIEVEEQ